MNTNPTSFGLHPERSPWRQTERRYTRVCGDVLALSQLVPTDDVAASFDAASFVTGAQAALIALFRPDQPMPSLVMEALEGRQR